MSVVYWNGCLGIAYYNVETTVLYMMPDVTETENYDFLRRGIYYLIICSLMFFICELNINSMNELFQFIVIYSLCCST